MKRFKKLLLGLVAFAAMAVLCAVCAGAETWGDYEYSVLDDGTVCITDYTGGADEIEIPATIDGMSVTSIGYYAFEFCDNLEIVKIPDGVTSIDEDAFSDCSSLTNITIPNSVTNIGDRAFECCYNLNNLKLPNSLRSIGNSAFSECNSLSNIEIPDGVESIGSCAFLSCERIKSILIPDSVTNIGDGAFSYCQSLTMIDVAEGNADYVSVDGILFSKDKTKLMCYPAGKSGESYVIPDGVTIIGDSAFGFCIKLSSITIPDSVKFISNYAFSCCSLISNIEIPDGVTSIGKYAYSDCRGLMSVEIPDSVKNIGINAFQYTKLLDNQSTTVKYADKWVIDCDSNAESVVIRDGTKGIADNAFDNCSKITSIEIPDSVISIGDSSFADCISLTSITIPDCVTSIGAYTFSRCTNLKSITIPDCVTSIGSGAFSDCSSFTSIEIPDSVTSIGAYAFSRCTNLKSITIPNSVQSIEIGAFDSCSSLISIEIPESVTTISIYTFNKCTNLKCVEIQDGVISIEDSAFSECSSLDSIIIPDSVTSIGDFAFSFCIRLKSAVLSNSLTSIKRFTFNNCVSLESIVIPNSVASVGEYAFFNCSNLSVIKIPDSVIGVGEYAIGFGDGIQKVDGCKIYCYSGTAGEIYAKENKLNYVLIDTPPTVVTGFTLAGRASNALRLNWNKNITADGYIIEQYKSGKWVRIAKIANNATTTYRVSGLSAGTAYKFRIKAYRMDGSTALYSDYTATLSARTNPSDITGLKLGGRASNALRLNWNKNTSASGYIIEQYKSGKWVRIAKIAGNATTTYRVSGLSAGTAYKFRMKAYKMSGSTVLYSGYTSTLSARTNPSNVTGVKIGGKSSNALRVNWTKNTSADGYIIEIYRGAGEWARIAKIKNNTTTTYRISGLSRSRTYKIRIKAYKMSGSTALYSGYTTISGKTTA